MSKMSKMKFSLDIDDAKEKENEQVDRKALKDFAKGALDHNTGNKTWREEDPDDLPSFNFRLRLNKYEVGLLKYVAKLENRSQSNMIKVVLIKELLKRIN